MLRDTWWLMLQMTVLVQQERNMKLLYLTQWNAVGINTAGDTFVMTWRHYLPTTCWQLLFIQEKV